MEIRTTLLLEPLNLGAPDARISLTDYRGRIVASNRPGRNSLALDENTFDSLSRSGKPNALLHRAEDEGLLSLVVVLPVAYRLTGNIEGLLALEIPLDRLLPEPTADTGSQLVSGEGYFAGQPLFKNALIVRERLSLPPALDSLRIDHVVAKERSVALHDLDVMIWLFVALGLVVVGMVVAFSRSVASYLSGPLRSLSDIAEEIAESGRPNACLVPRGSDEFGRLARAFNRMVHRLAESYLVLEARVEERTRALSRSEAQLRYVMDATGEGIWDWDIRSGVVSHNFKWCELLGFDQEFLSHPVEVFAQALHEEDREETMEAIRRCLEGGEPYYHEHRMRHSDGTVIWVLDRGAVVERAPDGGAIRMLGSISDITERKLASEQLKERELYLRATLDNVPFLFWLKDHDSRFLAVNRNFALACGLASPAEVVGKTDFDIWPEALASQYRADDQEVMAARVEKMVEEEPIQQGSGARWIETYKKPVVTEEGIILGTVGFARDITSRKEMEQQLAESEQRWELAVAGANDGIWDWHLESNDMYFSDRWKTMLGYEPADIEDYYDQWVSRIHPEDLPMVMEALTRHLEGETSFYETEHRLRCKNGDYKWILDRGRALFDESGKPIRMSGSHTDITEQRNARERLEERTEQLNAIFALSPDGFVSFDRDKRVLYASPAFQRMTGLVDQDVVGLGEEDFLQRVRSLCIDGGVPMDIARLAREGGDGGPRREVIELARAPRRVLEVGLRVSNSETVSQIMYFRDITSETEVDRMKSEFLSTAAHELRTPMASVYGFSELLLNEEFDRETEKELLGTISRQAGLMAHIINELLDLARIEARRGKDFVMEPVNLPALVQQALEGFKPSSGRLAPQFDWSGKALQIAADRTKLLQALNNVVSNAYKYSPDGGDVEIEIVCNGENMIGIAVRDHGIGMSEAEQARVGERFYRADTSGKIPGTGLGMAIVKEIIELHGGRVEISSQLGKGSRVILWLPAGESMPS